MFRQILTTLVVFIIAAASASAQEKKVPASLGEAQTTAEVEAYTKNALSKFAGQHTQGAEEFAEMLHEVGGIQLAAGDRIFEIALNDADREKGLLQKFHALKFLVQADEIRSQNQKPSDYQTAFDEILAELSKNRKYTAIVDTERYQQFVKKVVLTPTELLQKQFDQFVAEAKQWSNSQSMDDPAKPLILIVEKAVKNPQFVEKTLRDLTAFVHSEESTLTEEKKQTTLRQLEGYSRRIVGVDPEIYGKTVDGKDFDWAALRGKYVLVKFTASWCGPCKGEIPGMLSAYEKYHDRGLEIVSIYLWDKPEDSQKVIAEEKLPWLFLSEELTEKAGLPLQGKKYAVMSVPTMFLVDKDGKIIFTEARGEALQKKLEELFPEK
ncbi:MAG: TlpA family protein disulfide reductase [Planctomycetaceae bacterium]|jgi:thiol-disulfide isomerase/thioredoxin|nr:TlpA family protein disulfide reductase [Planctomycetaceae bacterium]